MQIKRSATPNLADKLIMTSLIGVASGQPNFGALRPLSSVIAPLSPPFLQTPGYAPGNIEHLAHAYYPSYNRS